MSALIVEVCRIEKILAHQNAERLELANIKGWQCVVPRGRHQAGDLVTYVPVDSVSHPDHATIWLDGWHRVFMNTETQSRAMRHVAFLD